MTPVLLCSFCFRKLRHTSTIPGQNDPYRYVSRPVGKHTHHQRLCEKCNTEQHRKQLAADGWEIGGHVYNA